MSTIGSMSNSNFSTMSAQMRPKPDPSKIASKLFSQLDSSNKGYVEKSDLQSAFDKISSSSSSSVSASSSVDELFSKLDGDSDGKITKDEMKSGIQQLAEQLDSQFNQMRMQGGGQMGGAGGMPPPLPSEIDQGFSKEELTSQLGEIGGRDSQRSSLISKIVDNFSAADTDGNGKVTAQEAMAYDQSTQSSSTTNAGTSSQSTSSQASSDNQLLKQIMELMKAYGQQDTQSHAEGGFSQISSLLSVTA